MEQQSVEQRLRELLTMQLGSQVLQMCELQAKLDAATAELDKLKAEKAQAEHA